MIFSGWHQTKSSSQHAPSVESRYHRRTGRPMAATAAACFVVLLGACAPQSERVLGSRAAGPNSEAPQGQESTSDDGESDTSDESEDSESTSDEPAASLSTNPDEVYEVDTCYLSGNDASDLELVDCSSEHDIEIYSVNQFDSDDDAPYQGLDEARAFCDPKFKEITGVGIGLATIFDRTVLRPSEETWEQGDRSVTCLVQYPEPISERLSEISPVRGFGLVSPYGMETGDCFEDFEDEASSFKLVSCDESHDVEVFVTEELTDPSFPGERTVEARADELCFGETFDEFVGTSYDNSNLFSLRSMPTELSWEQGDTKINCLLTLDEPRVGSFKGSAL